MKIESIKESAKKAIIELLNKQLQVEYAFIINYPRIIDKLIAVDKINDEQLNKDLERLGKDSTRHLGSVGQLIVQLGGEPMWQIEVIDRLVDVDNLLDHQLKKEKVALSLCQEAKRVAERNKVKVKVRDFLGRLIRVEDELPYDVLNASDVISTLERMIIDETHHIRLVHDSIATLNMFMNK
jgi:bacterioferritin (cytochrome b1)